MRRSEFQELADHVFGPVLARAYARDLVLADVDGLPAQAAIDAGYDVRTVWTALCDAMEVPESDRWEVPPHLRRRRG